MSNNRLYLIDTETDERILLAKSFGDGWTIFHPEEQLNEWLSLRDMNAGYGNASYAPTKFKLMTENDPEFKHKETDEKY